ncbi:MAG TPA: hypothetical protein VMW62_18060 [Chloroflexota bacterium]|nr:hypothetical protein [Chloroflexota bacterium]
MFVVEVKPVPLALPLRAVALEVAEELTCWLLVAVALPLLPVPELAPPAASTVPLEPVVLLLPLWPVAVAEPELVVAVPVLATVLELLELAVAPELPLFLAPPVMVAPLPPLLIVVEEFEPVAEALPLDALALLLVALFVF